MTILVKVAEHTDLIGVQSVKIHGEYWKLKLNFSGINWECFGN